MASAVSTSPDGARRVYRLLSNLAWSDGLYVPAERALLQGFRELHAISAAEAKALEAEGREGRGLRLGKDAGERELLLEAAVKLALVDGDLDMAEQMRLASFARVLGVEEDRVMQRLLQVAQHLTHFEIGADGRLESPAASLRLRVPPPYAPERLAGVWFRPQREERWERVRGRVRSRCLAAVPPAWGLGDVRLVEAVGPTPELRNALRRDDGPRRMTLTVRMVPALRELEIRETEEQRAP